MSNEKLKNTFISKATLMHKGKYDYSLVVYKNCFQKVKIKCPVHGVFEQSPSNHTRGMGCKKCAIDLIRRPICGVGINDLKSSTKCKAYKVWFGMIQRCYSQKVQFVRPTYKGCTVSEEWLRFSNFKKWHDANYVEGYHLDKDLLVKGNKVYSSETCCYVHPLVNIQISNTSNRRGSCCFGVMKEYRKYLALITKHGKQIRLGTFDTEEEAFVAYKVAKEQYIKELADKYYNESLITQKVYEALYKYEINASD